ncbi:hypothetical protein BEN78_12655 [Xanthomonas citri pv. mangiferaeindicae]|nr:hypothetical protein BEN78_12655 [Xanthomonas citri pv. mangiferaeindicae]
MVTVRHPVRWSLYQLGQLALGAGLISLVFNYGYRYTVDRAVNTPAFYAVTLALGLIVFVIWRRDAILAHRYTFSPQAIGVRTALGMHRTFPTADYAFVPVLHKVVNLPERKAGLSFHVRDRRRGRNVRHYTWCGFAADDFAKVARLYGYGGDTDFRQGDFGR